MNYLLFLTHNSRLLAFGFFGTFFSGFGQTYFISLFNNDIRAEFSLSHGEFSLLYSLATLASGISLIWLGRLVDRISLRAFITAVCMGLALACLLMALSHHWLPLLLALFLLRLNGQGLISHAAITTMARCFHQGRGKALSIAAMGFAVAEGVYPLIVVSISALVGWRMGWGIFSLFLAAVALPLLLWLQGATNRYSSSLTADNGRSGKAEPRSWTIGEVWKDPVFFLIVPAATAAPAVVTGIFFHQLFIADQKGWSLVFLASGFSLFALVHVLSILFMGPMVDRLGARRLLPFILLPMATGILWLALSSQPLVLFVYMALVAVTLGSAHPVINALWAEAYGTRFLGSIRALNQGIMVVSTAIAPVLMGFAIDHNASLKSIGLVVAAYIALCIGLSILGVRKMGERG